MRNMAECDSPLGGGVGSRSGADRRVCVLQVVTLVTKMCADFHLKLPKKEKIETLVKLCDKNGDGVLQESEFNGFFKVRRRPPSLRCAPLSPGSSIVGCSAPQPISAETRGKPSRAQHLWHSSRPV